MSEADIARRINEVFEREAARMYETDPEMYKKVYLPDGSAPTREYICMDQWIVAYSTKRSFGGPFDGKFVVMAYKPIGKGARKDPQKWERVYFKGFNSRKAAKRRCVELYYKHADASTQEMWRGLTPAEKEETIRSAWAR